PLGFSDKVVRVAMRTAARNLFDIRLDGDPQFQRMAAIRYPLEATGLMALAKTGLELRLCAVGQELDPFLQPLSAWAALPLREQANKDVRGHAALLLGALRNAGHFSRSDA
ncbi:hypothetical protein AB4144_13785, partial [Rhizobiaceae sp. 2RAB30]